MKKQQKYVMSKTDANVLATVKALIETDLRKHFTINELTQEVGMNRTKLCNGFKELFGFSIYQFIIQQRIDLSKKLLVAGELQIKVIAQQCGYKTIQHFVTAFKKSMGITPGEFQRNNINNKD